MRRRVKPTRRSGLTGDPARPHSHGRRQFHGARAALAPGGPLSDRGVTELQLVGGNRATTNLLLQREIAADKLNVVGENHPESDKRRGKETAYANKIAGGGYWREDEFALGDQTDWGDPKDLRLADLLSRTERHFATMGRSADTLLEADESKREPLWGPLTDLLEVGYQRMLTAVATEISAVVKLNKDGKYPLLDMTLKDFVPWARTALGHKKAVEKLLPKLKARTEDPDSLALDLWSTSTAVRDFSAQSIHKKFQGKKDLTKQRSAAMHQAANKLANKKGIWKIGQLHADDIHNNLDLDDSDLDYELVDRGDFTYYLENPTPSEASKLGYYNKK